MSVVMGNRVRFGVPFARFAQRLQDRRDGAQVMSEALELVAAAV